MKAWTALLAAVVLVAVAGCGASLHQQGQRLLDREEYGAAVEALRQALAAEPDNPRIHLGLAEGLYHQGDLTQAQAHVERARTLAPASGHPVLLQGLIHEKRGDRTAAISAYRGYTALSRLSPHRSIIEARLEVLIREQIREETRAAVAREEVLDVGAIPENTIAVTPFRNLGSDRSLDPLQRGLAEMMVTDLSKVKSLAVVERLRMQEMMKEIGLGMTGAVDASTAPRLGKLVGANRVVSGSFADLAGEQLRLDVSVAGTRTGQVAADAARGPLARLFRLQKELTFSLIEEMGLYLSEEEREAIQQIPTEDLLAFMAYSRGLELEDQGLSEEAEEQYREAVRRDPQFMAAQRRRDRAQAIHLGAGSRRALETQVLARARRGAPPLPGAAPRAARDPRAVAAQVAGGLPPPSGLRPPARALDRLVATGRHAGAGFIPAVRGSASDRRKPIAGLLREMEKITFHKDDSVIEIVVPLR